MKRVFAYLLLCIALTSISQVKPQLIVKFDHNSFTLNKVFTDSLKRYKDLVTTIVIKGYADSSGNSHSNLLLSEKRAKAVYAMLKHQNKKCTISYEFFGEQFSNNNDQENNRRVEVYVSSPLITPTVTNIVTSAKDGIKIKSQKNTVSVTNSALISSTKNMIKYKMFAVDVNGGALTTAGMIDMELESGSKDTVEVSFPAESEYDPEMELYDGVLQEDGTTLWVLSQEKLMYDSLTKSYTFKQNLDKGKQRFKKNADKRAPRLIDFLVYTKGDVTDMTLTDPSLTFVKYMKWGDTLTVMQFSNPKNVDLDSTNIFTTISYSQQKQEYGKSYKVNTLLKKAKNRYIVKDDVFFAVEKTPVVIADEEAEAVQEEKQEQVGFFKRLWRKLFGKK